jgi:hypothetical protein
MKQFVLFVILTIKEKKEFVLLIKNVQNQGEKVSEEKKRFVP